MDGTVKTVVAEGGAIDQIKAIFNKDSEAVFAGKYRITGNKISFQVIYTNGSGNFNGYIYDDKLILDLQNNFNGNVVKNGVEFKFRKW